MNCKICPRFKRGGCNGTKKEQNKCKKSILKRIKQDPNSVDPMSAEMLGIRW
mgnify:CR=1 FL=1